jgi:hypothetical protein
VEPIPEVIEGPELGARDLPSFAADVDAGESCLVEKGVELVRTAVDELRAELDGKACVGVAEGEDATADAFACLEDDDFDACFVESASGRESCRSSAYDHHVCLEGRRAHDDHPRKVPANRLNCGV